MLVPPPCFGQDIRIFLPLRLPGAGGAFTVKTIPVFPELPLHLLAEVTGQTGGGAAAMSFGLWNPSHRPTRARPALLAAPPPDPPPRGTRQPTLPDQVVQAGLATNDELRRWYREAEELKTTPWSLAMREWHRKDERRKLTGFLQILESLGITRFDTASLATFAGDDRSAALRTIVRQDLAVRYRVFPILASGNMLTILMSEPPPYNEPTLQDIRFALSEYVVDTVFAFPHEIDQAIETYYGVSLPPILVGEGAAGSTAPLDHAEPADDIIALPAGGPTEDAGMRDWVNRLLGRAYHENASDIHLIPKPGGLDIYFRLLGDLRYVESVPMEQAKALLATLMRMADLAAEKAFLPLDSRIARTAPGKKRVIFRVGVGPTVHGIPEIVLRLQKVDEGIPLEQLGLNQLQLGTLLRAARAPNGIIYVTGPTGSGKTTTLYALLERLQQERPSSKIMTVEDPVERMLRGPVTQTQVNRDRGYDFAGALRSFLRRDPDMILVGETRDRETADISAEAADTGHLVLTTLHANDALATIGRLSDLGAQIFRLTDKLRVVVAQRLTRILCSDCRDTVTLTRDGLLAIGIPEMLAGVSLFQATGTAADGGICTKCKGAGYSGRRPLFEVLPGGGVMGSYISAVRRQGDSARADAEAEFRKMGCTFFREEAGQLLVAGEVSPLDFASLITDLNG